MTMAPSCESSITVSAMPSNNYTAPQPHTSYEPLSRKPAASDRKTIAFGVNYEASMVDRYYAGHKTEKMADTYNPTLLRNTGSRDTNEQETNEASGTSRSSTATPTIVEDEEACTSNGGDSEATTTTSSSNATLADTPSGKRRSAREQKQRSVTMTPVKVRYDMEQVPSVERRTVEFWKDVTVWPPRVLRDPTLAPPPIMPSPVGSSKASLQLPPRTQTTPTPVPHTNPGPLPYSVVWKPSKRKDWEDSVSEMTAVCTSAALRKYNPKASHKFVPPLSREYLRDRIDIDDPLRGYQLRHQVGGWLQGFVLWTNFTTWTHYFTWDSLHAKSGIAESPYPLKDTDGSLSRQLQALPRSGDPLDSGIVFDHVAEIALLGGLGCGELCLRMALEDILRSDKEYKFVVLQATNGSRTFYERFGFQRVGAICRYGTNQNSATNTGTKSKGKKGKTRKDQATTRSSGAAASTRSANKVSSSASVGINHAIPTLETPIQGYRHWTHANESQQSLDLHGGPSYMMVLKLPETPVEGLNLLERLSECFVEDKPTIEPLGSATTPNLKRKLKRQSTSGVSQTNFGQPPPLPNLSASIHSSPMVSRLTTAPFAHVLDSNNKRRKVSMDKVDLGPVNPAAPEGFSSFVLPTVGGRPAPSLAMPMPPASTSSAVTSRRKSKTSTTAAPKTLKTPKTTTQKKIKRSPPPPSAGGTNDDIFQQVVPTPGIHPVDRTTLVKQKVKSYPRDRVHFYNKVVKKEGTSGTGVVYYFVLHYSADRSQITVCPMTPRGILSGKRQGRPRYQCLMLDNTSNWIISAPTTQFEAVPAFMVMKTPLVAQEAWDINGQA